MTAHGDQPDLLIIGSGIMGASVARLVRESLPHAHIVMVDGAPSIGSVPGLHLHDSADPEVWARYNTKVSSGIQAMYAGADLATHLEGGITTADPGIYRLGAFGEQAGSMPAAAMSWNLGGMGVHWTAATPFPLGEERFDDGDPEQWERDLETARRILYVDPGPLGATAAGARVLEVFEELFPLPRRARLMPMAVAEGPNGTLIRSGPSRIWPGMLGDDDRFTLLDNSLAVELVHDGSIVSGARIRDPRTGSERVISAAATVVCADAIRTPQLLFASGIRPRALGAYLNEHAFITSRVLLDLDRLGLTIDELPRPKPGEFATDALWLPHNDDAQPFHGQVTGVVYVDDDDTALAYSTGISLYSPVESRESNRLVFSETELDATGMPLIDVEFEYSESDRARIDDALDLAEKIARRLGDFDPHTERALLPPGSSLHQTGTVRSGPVDDSTSVCDPDGRVWNFRNLFLAGNGVVPTPVVCNATLTGVITAVRASRAIVDTLDLTASEKEHHATA
ncbi:hypothetical protein M2152_001846 [Microbacteriaceae bacterium SG_E_30_P1]|uniref:Glucose-methanol-choline oxidoreductase C-terminal domain-containing protein n=1 Tax=Antiquaquibacter oligotrophicus TaxID=2880260 RepID=A0ABT6KNT4_9MICO|nr:GMC family oxidoreductase [Antiquaquibacter oligotrophicus]MDH6181664.1 hypothetical protein [Antiquaquibacter oligotrophicus]UDF12652.1 hypothetical protein LH407_10870 [Antiquaquibacter oligotrophicus]